MENKKVLFISQEIMPYLPENEMSRIGRYLPQGIQENGKEVRVFMPRFGLINERRNQLHEVIRLSGMNLIIDGNDHSLIIKVASIQKARIQVYFIDNEDYFKRKHKTSDAEGNFFEDNDERMIFFARGVLETVRKLRWIPDLIHCHGWMSSLVPLYIKTAYKNDPMFSNSKVVYSLYDDAFDAEFKPSFIDKVTIEGIDKKKDLEPLQQPDYTGLTKLAAKFSDGFIIGNETVKENTLNIAKETGKPLLGYQDEESYIEKYSNFYDDILSE